MRAAALATLAAPLSGAFLAAILLAAPPPAAAQPASRSLAPLRAEVWAETQPVSASGDPWPVPPEELERRLRAEAAWIFGGMTQGFEFSYTPSDKVRGIAESFILRSLGGPDPSALVALPPALASARGTKRSSFECAIDRAAAAALESFSREPWKSSQGRGKADLLGGHPARLAAYEDALREAVRELARALEANKPRSVKGRVVLSAPPSIHIEEGEYRVQA
ncbi:MAG: hypothetical protein Q8M76_12975, partial [Spirochaetaceae bacterium]|nr:hypothetical protein [Spirochaetaceae bacterium]